MDADLLYKSYQDWQNFVNRLTDEERKLLSIYDQDIAVTSLYYLKSFNDAIKFDQTVNKMSNRYLYHQEIIPTIYNYYNERNLHEVAYDYITKAEIYLKSSGVTILPNITSIFAGSISTKLLESLKNSLSHIRSIKPDDLSRIVPDILNDKRLLSEFILGELVQAARILTEKVHGIKQITHEDRYNDLLLAVLRLRLPVWGWEVADQSRTGHSATGVSAGEVDIIIKGGGNTIALFEALILSRKNKSLTQKHIKKTTDYANFLDRYYMIVYYTGGKSGFDKVWKDYKDDAAATAFPTKYVFDKAKGYEDLAVNFGNIASLRIAKSSHGKSEFFHVMIDLSR